MTQATKAESDSESVEEVRELDTVTIRFAGDSGDGIQLAGSRFTNETALIGNDLATLPDFPAEIRAPAGSLPGVSGFQLQFSSHRIFTPGDAPDALVALNPAALKRNIDALKPGGIVIVDTGTFDKRNLKKAHYDSNPLEDGSLDGYQVCEIDITKLTKAALEDVDMDFKAKMRCRNFFTLGVTFWLYSRKLDNTLEWIAEKFKNKPTVIEANQRALKAGYNYGDTAGLFQSQYKIHSASLEKGKYRNITGNKGTALGFVTAARKAGLSLFLGSYPITPASDILHELSRLKHFDVVTFQAEDEIAGVCSAIGASWGGALALTTTSGPGLALKGEAIGLAVSVELPMVIANIQRAGPSTGMPTKTEQADLLQALYGRNGESPVAVVAASRPGDSFEAAYEAARIALEHKTPVVFLSDGYIANGSEPWKIPDVNKIPKIDFEFRTDPAGFEPFMRDEEKLTTPWAVPGTPELEHRIGGLEKEHLTGNVSYDPDNHQLMTDYRQGKIDRIANHIPEAAVDGPESGDLLVLGWGSTYGAIKTSTDSARRRGLSVAHCHLRYLNPFPKNLGEILSNYDKVLIPELNMGQLLLLVRARFLKDAVGLNKVEGQPFTATEITAKINELLGVEE